MAIGYQQVGGEKVKVAKVDIPVLQEMRAISEQIARELGEWRDQASVQHTIKSPADIPLNVLDMLEAEARAELAAVIEQRQLAAPSESSTIATNPTQASNECAPEEQVIDLATLNNVSKS